MKFLFIVLGGIFLVLKFVFVHLLVLASPFPLSVEHHLLLAAGPTGFRLLLRRRVLKVVDFVPDALDLKLAVVEFLHEGVLLDLEGVHGGLQFLVLLGELL